MHVATREPGRPVRRDRRRGGLLGGVRGQQPAVGDAPADPRLQQRGLEHGRGPVAETLAQHRHRPQTVVADQLRRPENGLAPADDARYATSSRVKA